MAQPSVRLGRQGFCQATNSWPTELCQAAPAHISSSKQVCSTVAHALRAYVDGLHSIVMQFILVWDQFILVWDSLPWLLILGGCNCSLYVSQAPAWSSLVLHHVHFVSSVSSCCHERCMPVHAVCCLLGTWLVSFNTWAGQLSCNNAKPCCVVTADSHASYSAGFAVLSVVHGSSMPPLCDQWLID